jgi:hypothetical protein
VKAAQELLGALTIGGESARPGGGGGWRESEKLNKPSEFGMYKNGAKTAGFPHLLT